MVFCYAYSRKNYSYKEVEKDYARLSKLTNENINTRVRIYNNEAQPAVPPLTLAIYHADNWSDSRFLSLIKNSGMDF